MPGVHCSCTSYWLYLDCTYRTHKIRIVLGGGAKLIDLLLDECKQEDPIQVIFVRGSGGAADVVSYAHRLVSLHYNKN